jgi:hypothetical protein
VSSYVAGGNAGTSIEDKGGTYGVGVLNSDPVELHVTRGATEKSREWDGWGTAAKPAHEVWWLVQKPIEKGMSIADNVLKWGTGGLNIDACRVGFASKDDKAAAAATAQRLCHDQNKNRTGYGRFENGPESLAPYLASMDAGRFPANFLLTHDHRCQRIGSREVKANNSWDSPNRECVPGFTSELTSPIVHGQGGVEAVPVYECHESCPVMEMDRQSGESKSTGGLTLGFGAQQGMIYGTFNDKLRANAGGLGDTGTASRFFPQFEYDPDLDDISPFIYIAKPSRSEKDAGLDHFRERTGGEATDREEDSAGTQNPRAGAGRTGGARNVHPTSKGIGLLEYLTKYITQPGGLVIDLFSGGGTGGIAAVRCGFRWIGADINDTDEEPFISIARARITYVFGGLYVPRESLRSKEPPAQRNLFEVAS